MFALFPSYLAAVVASGYRQALDTDPEPELSSFILHALLTLLALVLAIYVLIGKIVKERGDAVPGREWSRYTDVLVGTAVTGAIAGIPLGAFVSPALVEGSPVAADGCGEEGGGRAR
ncbi:hypothetical protein [Streptomyces sp. NPDC090056]|uniref:hypothetical protein n=1 Tax=Streptomyces sp. NPDC090056 TaxID=3365934 RepID=UPI003801921B